MDDVSRLPPAVQKAAVKFQPLFIASNNKFEHLNIHLNDKSYLT